MSTLDDVAQIAFFANTRLAESIRDYNKIRARLIEAHAEQSVSIRALAAVSGDHDYVKRGQELELRAVQTLANHHNGSDS